MSDIETARKIFKDARMKTLVSYPFFGHILLGIDYVETDQVPTCGTDGVRYYWNPEFVATLSVDEMIFIHAHEVSHIIYQHFGRAHGRNKRVWNFAGDYAINEHLVKEMIGTTPDDILLDEKYNGMIAEEIYEKLKEEIEQSAKSISEMTDEELEEMFGNNFDTHFDGTDLNLPKPTAEEIERLKRVCQQSAQTNKGSGNTSSGPLEKIIADAVSEQVNWQDYLREQISSKATSDYSFSKRSKGSLATNFYMPSIIDQPSVNIHIALDTSGSISTAETSTFLGEVKSIIQSYEDFDIDLWSFDTAVHNHKNYKTHCSENFEQYQPMGGGGTDFECNWEYMKEESIVPDQLIVLTDGYPYGGWGDETYCDTIFVIINDREIEPPFGTPIHVESLV